MIKLVKNPQGEVVAFGGHEGYEPVVPEGYTLELVESYTPTPTLAEQAEAVRHALQEAIDIKSRGFGFSSGNSLILYAGFPSPFQPLAQQFATWEASVWFEADNYKDQVIDDGTKPMLSPAEAVAMMPAYPA